MPELSDRVGEIRKKKTEELTNFLADINDVCEQIRGFVGLFPVDANSPDLARVRETLEGFVEYAKNPILKYEEVFALVEQIDRMRDETGIVHKDDVVKLLKTTFGNSNTLSDVVLKLVTEGGLRERIERRARELGMIDSMR